MFSMTGFGKGEYKADGIEISVEVKTVNNRYLDVAIKSPKKNSKICFPALRTTSRSRRSCARPTLSGRKRRRARTMRF